MTKKILILTALTLVVTGLNGCGIFGKNDELIPEGKDLGKEYVKSKDDFNKKYNGKETVFWGIVDNINNLGDTAKVRFKDSPGEDSGIPKITCIVDKPDMSKFSDMKVEAGTWVRVKGTMSVDEKESSEKLQVKSCKLVTTGAGNVMRDS